MSASPRAIRAWQGSCQSISSDNQATLTWRIHLRTPVCPVRQTKKPRASPQISALRYSLRKTFFLSPTTSKPQTASQSSPQQNRPTAQPRRPSTTSSTSPTSCLECGHPVFQSRLKRSSLWFSPRNRRPRQLSLMKAASRRTVCAALVSAPWATMTIYQASWKMGGYGRPLMFPIMLLMNPSSHCRNQKV